MNRLIREVGPMSDVAPEFPLAAAALASPARNQRGQARVTSVRCGQAKRFV